MQQYLPFTVLKLQLPQLLLVRLTVATVLTVYGIETDYKILPVWLIIHVATVLTVYGIETRQNFSVLIATMHVATVLTVYGIETSISFFDIVNT